VIDGHQTDDERPDLRRARSALPVAALLLICAGLAAPTTGEGAETPPDGSALWERSLQRQRLPDLRSDVTLTTTTRAGETVTLNLHGVGVLQENGIKRSLLVRVTSGGTLQGTGFLSIEHVGAPSDLWVYLPALGWARRLIAGNLGDSYLGSEFRYGDLIQPEPGAYVVTTRGSEVVDGRPCWVIEAVPRDRRLESDTGLSREVRWLSKEDLLERRTEQYDRRGELLKVMDWNRWTETRAPGRWLALERRIENLQTRATSRAVFGSAEVGVGLSESLFVPRSLGEAHW
jgi:hypothetical protein